METFQFYILLSFIIGGCLFILFLHFFTRNLEDFSQNDNLINNTKINLKKEKIIIENNSDNLDILSKE